MYEKTRKKRELISILKKFEKKEVIKMKRVMSLYKHNLNTKGYLEPKEFNNLLPFLTRELSMNSERVTGYFSCVVKTGGSHEVATLEEFFV